MGPLNEYSYYIANEIRKRDDVELIILADELEEYKFATDVNGKVIAHEADGLPGVKIIRCWKVDSLANPARILKVVRELNPDVVWFNLVFSSFGTPKNPVAAFLGLSAPALTRATGFYTHITLHHIIEHVDFKTASKAASRHERLLRRGTDLATRALLRANSVSVLLSNYRRTLVGKYAARNIMVGTHGTFATMQGRPDMTKRGNPEHRVMAFGNWGTYKRLETLVEAFPSILARCPNARLVIAGGNHPAAAGYWESVKAKLPSDLPVEFLGYVQQKDVAELFRTSTMLVMPYDSSTGSSGPAHQACEFGLPIVCADIADFQCMANDDDMAISFYKIGDSADLADKVVEILDSDELQREMSNHNYEAGVAMTMGNVARTYLRWFELHKLKRLVRGEGFKERMRWRLWDLWYGRDTLVPRLRLRNGKGGGNESPLHQNSRSRRSSGVDMAPMPPMPLPPSSTAASNQFHGQA